MTITTSADPEGWSRALDEDLRDMDSYADWAYGHCARTDRLSDEVVRKLTGLLSVGRVAEARAFGIPELVFVLLTETPDIAMAARAELRDRILAAHSGAVSRLYWKAKDAEREAATMDLDDDSPVDVGCEFDGVVR